MGVPSKPKVARIRFPNIFDRIPLHHLGVWPDNKCWWTNPRLGDVLSLPYGDVLWWRMVFHDFFEIIDLAHEYSSIELLIHFVNRRNNSMCSFSCHCRIYGLEFKLGEGACSFISKNIDISVGHLWPNPIDWSTKYNHAQLRDEVGQTCILIGDPLHHHHQQYNMTLLNGFNRTVNSKGLQSVIDFWTSSYSTVSTNMYFLPSTSNKSQLHPWLFQAYHEQHVVQNQSSDWQCWFSDVRSTQYAIRISSATGTFRSSSFHYVCSKNFSCSTSSGNTFSSIVQREFLYFHFPKDFWTLQLSFLQILFLLGSAFKVFPRFIWRTFLLWMPSKTVFKMLIALLWVLSVFQRNIPSGLNLFREDSRTSSVCRSSSSSFLLGNLSVIAIW